MSRAVYLAGASAEATQTATYIQRLRAAGLSVTLDWTVPVWALRGAGKTDRDLPEAERARHAAQDLDAIARAEFVWLLVPEAQSWGCWTEFGAAIALRKFVLVSGDWRRSIFTALAQERFDEHEEALRWLTS